MGLHRCILLGLQPANNWDDLHKDSQRGIIAKLLNLLRGSPKLHAAERLGLAWKCRVGEELGPTSPTRPDTEGFRLFSDQEPTAPKGFGQKNARVPKAKPLSPNISAPPCQTQVKNMGASKIRGPNIDPKY